MIAHQFLLTPGEWIGEGTIHFSISPEKIKFRVQWSCLPGDDEKQLLCAQRVEMVGGGEAVQNRFHVAVMSATAFTISIENEMIGMVNGQGVVSKETIAWEFHSFPDLEGYEVYEKDGERYRMKGEYLSGGNMRTFITGHIWQRKENE